MVDITQGGANQLRKNSLGLIAVTFMVISAAAPLTGVAGAMPLAFMLGNGTGIPAMFIFVTLVMLAFAAGYVAMSRHVTNAGAFYAYADASRFTNDSLAFCKRMLTEAGVAASPGVDFDRVNGGRFLRFSYAGSRQTVEKALERLQGFLPR